MKKSIIYLQIVLLFAACTKSLKDDKTFEKGNFWISFAPETAEYKTTEPAPYFRKEFMVYQEIEKAKLKVTGVGYYEFYLNGQKVGDHLLAPAVTRYDKTILFEEFDITKYIQKGINTAGSIVGNGFYNIDTKSAWDYDKAPWRGRPAFTCEIEVQYKDGKSLVLHSDSTWKTTFGSIIFNQLRNGETYDANKKLKDWNLNGFDDSQWSYAYSIKNPTEKLTKQEMPPIKKTKTLQPVSITEPVDGKCLVDFGQNISGWAKIKINEPKGDTIKLKYGERIFENGLLDQKELSRFIWTGETQTTTYISDGSKNREYEPRFTYFGFQYVQVEGLSRRLQKDEIEAYMMHTAFDTIGYFHCSNELLNKIHNNIQWSYLGNYHSFPEDCPHREKMAWTGDAQLVIETALFNYDSYSAYKKWLRDFRDEQQESGDLPGIVPTSGWGYNHGKDSTTAQFGYGPHWEGALVTIPWQMYLYLGDKSILKENYEAMKKYIAHLENISINYLLNFGIDDHKSIITHTEGAYISTAYFHWLTQIMTDVADALEKPEGKSNFSELSKKIFDSFNEKYYDSSKSTYGNGGQTQMALALGCDLVPEENYERVLAQLVKNIEEKDYHFDCGVVGLKKIIDVLLENNRKDVLYKLATRTDFPSIGHWIEQ
ncbi:MAG: family 78 glycoside hydrolase catalytic domain, partial [Draconibacterium sp.]|nr:family 78 glycoside hydrolase catalytic domain [Draconibacterium sp.]